jgi:hypothetical protein
MILGICFEKGGFRAVWLTGSKKAPQLVDRDRATNPHTNPTDSAMWAYGRIEQILARNNVNSVVAKISIDLKSQDAVLTLGAPLGLLAYQCEKAGISLTLITKNKLNREGTYSLPKGTKPASWIDTLKDGKPHWDTSLRDAALAAASELA